MSTEAELAQSREAGESARRAGRELKTCPTYAIGRAGEDRRRAWTEAWESTGKKIAAERRR